MFYFNFILIQDIFLFITSPHCAFLSVSRYFNCCRTSWEWSQCLRYRIYQQSFLHQRNCKEASTPLSWRCQKNVPLTPETPSRNVCSAAPSGIFSSSVCWTGPREWAVPGETMTVSQNESKSILWKEKGPKLDPRSKKTWHWDNRKSQEDALCSLS